MRDRNYNGQWIDQYLRNELSDADEAAFETALLESCDLQQELETSLALRAVLDQASEKALASDRSESHRELLESDSGWRSLTLAAAVLLAVVSTVMWWKSGNDLATMERQMQAMSRPLAEVLTVPVNIMRSAGSQTPEVIVQKPQGRVALLLDIELGLQAREQSLLEFELVDQEEEVVLAWQSASTAGGRTRVVIPGASIPASQLWLQISDLEGEILERRLLEFRD